MNENFNTTNIMCFHSNVFDIGFHYHSCYQIVVSTQLPYDSLIENKEYKNLRGFILNKITKHSCTAKSGSFLVYYIESKSFLGKQVKRMLNNNNFIDIETLLSQKQLEKLSADFAVGNLSSAEMKILANNVLYDIFKINLKPTIVENIDDRITKAVEFIHQNLGEKLTLESVANHIFLSPERTRHLFLQEVEMPFSQFVLWKRIKAVLTLVIENKKTFFEASLQYGFTDQTHFNKFFKRMFGTTATKVLKNCHFLQFN